MKTEFEITKHLQACILRAREAGFDRDWLKASESSCGTGRLNGTTWAQESFDHDKKRIRSYFSPGVYDYLTMSKSQLLRRYHILTSCDPTEIPDSTDEERQTIVDLKRAVTTCYKASPLVRLALCADSLASKPEQLGDKEYDPQGTPRTEAPSPSADS